MAATNYRFKGHEKFPLREGWLNKGIIVERDSTKSFIESDGPDIYGVGNNMVKSIRYWMKAFGISVEKGNGLTTFGELIANNDKYLEDNFTWWLLHSKIAKAKNVATTWYLFFNKCDVDEFSKENIKHMLYNEAVAYTGSNAIKESAVNDDTDVLLNMYCKERTQDYDPEDKNVSPMSVLGLVKKVGETYYKIQPAMNKISKWVVLYELYTLFEDEETNELSIDRIVFGERSIGAIYNLSKVAINEYLDELDKLEYIRVVRTAGLDVVYKQSELSSDEIIKNYYNEYRTR